MKKLNFKSLNLDNDRKKQVIGIIKGTISPEEYKSVKNRINQCFNKPRKDELKMCALNELLCGYGVESITTEEWQNGYWCNILFTYVNMGDTYVPTVINHREKGFIISSWGDMIEHEIRKKKIKM